MGNYLRKKAIRNTNIQQYENNDIRFISKRDSIITKNDVIMLKQRRQYHDKYDNLNISMAVILIEPNTCRNTSYESYNNLNVPQSSNTCKTSNL
jgi:predicted Zn-ribbon and HTH transcriptional regulator